MTIATLIARGMGEGLLVSVCVWRVHNVDWKCKALVHSIVKVGYDCVILDAVFCQIRIYFSRPWCNMFSK